MIARELYLAGPRLIHQPDFDAVTAEERATGYTSRCAVCGSLLASSIEFIGSACRGPKAVA